MITSTLAPNLTKEEKTAARRVNAEHQRAFVAARRDLQVGMRLVPSSSPPNPLINLAHYQPSSLLQRQGQSERDQQR